MSRFPYKFVVGNGDFYSGNSWGKEDPTSDDPPPTPIDLANITNGGTATSGEGVVTANGGSIIVANASTLMTYGPLLLGLDGSSSSNISTRSKLTAYGSLSIGVNKSSYGSLSLSDSNTVLSTGGSPITIGDGGTGALLAGNKASIAAAGSTVTLGRQQYSGGTLSLTSGATFKSSKLQIGVAGVATASASGAGSTLVSDSISIGNYGTFAVTSGGEAADTGMLTMMGGTIAIQSGSGLEIGGQLKTFTNTLQIDGKFKGYGLIDSDTTGKVKVGPITVPKYSLSLIDNGSIEVQDNQKLVVHANLSGTGTIKIDSGATLELGGDLGKTVSIDFQGTGSGTLIIDALPFSGKTSFNLKSIENLSDGDKIVLKGFNPDVGDNTGISFANIGMSDSSPGESLLIGALGPPYAPSPSGGGTVFRQIIPLDSSVGPLDFFQVSKSGQDTVLEFQKGDQKKNQLDEAVNGQSVKETGVGIRIGIISKGAEAAAMANIIKAIAPNAKVDIVDINSGTSLSKGVQAFTSAHYNIIVDDIGGIGPEITDLGLTNAIKSAYAAGITLVTAAGNDRTGLNLKPGLSFPIFGHAANPLEISVAAMNLLASRDTQVGGYLPANVEPFSSQGIFSTRPTLTGPDGGQAIYPSTNAGNHFNPFFGTSAAAPAVAAVAALMMEANNQLEMMPGQIASLLSETATPLPQSSSLTGDGYVDANAAVEAAGDPPTYFVQPTTQTTAVVANAYLSQAAGDADTGATIKIVVQLGSSVTVAGGTPTLSFNSGNTAASYDAAASDPADGRLTFDYTIAAGDHATNLQITGFSLNGATVTGPQSNAADFSALLNTPTGLSINSPLAVASMSAAVTSGANSKDAMVGDTVVIKLAFQEAGKATSLTVNTTGGNPTLLLDDYATATYDAADSDFADGLLAFSYKVGAGDETPNLSVLRVDVPDGTTIRDANGNNADFSSTATFSSALHVGAAYVQNFTSTTSAVNAFYAGQKIQFTLGLSDSLTVTGAPKLVFDIGAVATYDVAASHPSAGTLVFDYTVGAHDEDPDLYVASVNLNGGTVKDSFGNAADLSGVVNQASGLQIGSLGVLAVAASSSLSYAATGQVLQIALAFGGPVKITTTATRPTLTLNDKATATYDAAASDPTNGILVFDYTVGSKDQTPNLAVTKVNLNGGTVKDNAGHAIDFSAVASLSTGLTINTPLTVTALGGFDVQTNLLTGTTEQISVQLSKSATVDTSAGSPTLVLNDGNTATYDAGASSAGLMVFDAKISASDYAASLAVSNLNLNGAKIRDALGNNADISGAVSVVTDTYWNVPFSVNAASIRSVTSSVSGVVLPGTNLTLTMNFGQAVVVDTTLGSPTLTLSDGDVAVYDAAASNLANGLIVFDDSVTTNSQPGTLTVTQVSLNGSTISDLHGNAANLNSPTVPTQPVSPNIPISTGTAVGPVYSTYLTTDPQSGTLATPLTPGTSIHLIATFDGKVLVNTNSGNNIPVLILNDGGVAAFDDAATAALNDPTKLAFDYTVGANDRTDDLEATGIQFNGATISDANGNSVASVVPIPTPVDRTFITVGTAASLTGVSVSSPLGFSGQTLKITLNLSNSVAVDTSNGPPTLTLSDGATATFDATASGNGFATRSLVFDYTVGAGEVASNLSIGSINNAKFGATVGFGGLTDPLGVMVNAPAAIWASTSSQSAEVVTGQMIAVAVAFNEAVTVNTAGGSPTLSLDASGTTETATYDAAASNAQAGYLVFDYTASGGDVTSELKIKSVNLNGATIQASGLSANLSGVTNFGLGVGVNVPTLPTLVSAGPASGSAHFSPGAAVQLVVTLNEAVTVASGVPTLTMSDGVVATYNASLSNLKLGQLWFDYTVAANDTPQQISISQLNLNGATIADAQGHTANFSNISQLALGITVGSAGLSPAVTLTSPLNEVFAGQTAEFTYSVDTYGKTIVVDTTGGSPVLKMSNGVGAVYDAAKSDLFEGNLVFDYVAGSNTSAVPTQIVLNGAKITDAFGRDLHLDKLRPTNLTGVGSSPYQLGPVTVAPNVIVNPEDLELKTGKTYQIPLTMSVNAVTTDTSGGTPTLTLSNGATATYDVNASRTNVLVFDYKIGANDLSSGLKITGINLNGATFRDPNGINIDLGNVAQNVLAAISNNQYVNVTVNQPTINSLFASAVIPASGKSLVTGQSAELDVAFSDSVIVNISGGSPTLTLSDGATATYDAAKSSGSIVAFDYTVGANDASTKLSATILNLNGATIRAAGGQAAAFGNLATYSFGLAVNVPAVASVTPSQTAQVLPGNTLQLIIDMTQSVSVDTLGGAPTLNFDDGGSATYDAGLSTATELVFDYVVGQNEFSPNLGIVAFNLNGAIVTGTAGGLNANLSGAKTSLGVKVGDHGYAYVASGITSSGTAVDQGYSLTVLSGGTAIATTLKASTSQIVSSGGVASRTQISGGSETIYGRSTSATVFGGGQQIQSGGLASASVVLGGTLELGSGGVASASIVSATGTMHVDSGGIARATLLSSGGNELVDFGGVDSGTRISGGSETVSGVASGTIVAQGVLTVQSGGVASGATISSGATLDVMSGGKAIATHLLAGGTQILHGATSGLAVTAGQTVEIVGGLVSKSSVASGGTLELLAGATQSGVTVAAGGILEVGSGSTVSNYQVAAGTTLAVASGGSASAVTVLADGKLLIASGGAVSASIVKSGGLEVVSAGGATSGITVSSGGLFEWVGSNPVVSAATFLPGAILEAGPGFTLSGSHVTSGMIVKVLSGGADSALTASAGGFATVLSGGTDSSATIADGGSITVSSGGKSVSATISGATNSGGKEIVQSGGVASSGIVSGTGQLIVSSGGSAVGTTISGSSLSGGLRLLARGSATSSLVGSGGAEFVTSGGLDLSATVASGGALAVSSGGIASGTTISSGGRATIAAGAVAAGMTLSSGGLVTNGGIVEGLPSNAAQLGGVVSNSAIVEALGTSAGLIVSGGSIVNSAAGAVVASGSAAHVDLDNATITSGTLRTAGVGAVIKTVNATSLLSAVSIASSANIVVAIGTELDLGGRIVDSGTITVSGLAVVLSGGAISGATISAMRITGGEADVKSGGALGLATVSSGGALIVSSGGVAHHITISSGGSETIQSGGLGSASTILNGGYETVSSGATISATKIAGGTLELAGGSILSGSIAFGATSGTLLLDQSATFSGTVAGMTAQDKLDLADIEFATVHVTSSFTNTTSGSLTVTDGAMHSAHIVLLGNYMASTFSVSSDVNGGTVIVDPPADKPAASLAQNHG